MKSSSRRTRTVRIGSLARVEGEGGLYIRLKGGSVAEVRLNIFEAPRFFEAFLCGRDFREAPDITARICGICPVAYQMSAVHALENALGIQVGGQLRNLRRLLYCGEWIESHALHVYMLHAPDFLGFDDGIAMARNYPDIVQKGLQLKKTGNAIVALLGGREIHPINVRIGGFYKLPLKEELAALVGPLEQARDTALETVGWTAAFSFPELEQDYEFVALRHSEEYPLNEGRIVSSSGLDIAPGEYDAHFTEEHVSYSNALHSVLKGRGAYLTGPLARYNLNYDRLSPLVQNAARAADLEPRVRNPFKSIVVRALEILYACDEALRLISIYEPSEEAAVDVVARAAVGAACTEAPRGMLYHRYRIEADGSILDAKIVPPTSQNQKSIETDLRAFVAGHYELPQKDLEWSCEQVVRNHDPCISCATHFLKLELERDDGK